MRPKLHINLIGHWYDMVESKIKLEEYREITDYWKRRFCVYPDMSTIIIKGIHYSPEDVDIVISNGYSKTRRQMIFPCKGLSIKTGKEDWGAEPGKEYFTLKLSSHE